MADDPDFLRRLALARIKGAAQTARRYANDRSPSAREAALMVLLEVVEREIEATDRSIRSLERRAA